jgi:hypothetical protein
MKCINREQLQLEPDESELLIWNITNEVINGFKVVDFEKTIGASEESFKMKANHLRAVSKSMPVVIDRQQAQIFCSALSVVLNELGIEEFQTRTGYDFEDGHLLLQELNHFLREELTMENS